MSAHICRLRGGQLSSCGANEDLVQQAVQQQPYRQQQQCSRSSGGAASKLGSVKPNISSCSNKLPTAAAASAAVASKSLPTVVSKSFAAGVAAWATKRVKEGVAAAARKH